MKDKINDNFIANAINEYTQNRIKKLVNWGNIQKNYPDSFEITNNAASILTLNENIQIACTGRIMLMRIIGKITFLKIKDFSGNIQIVLKNDELGEKTFDFLCNNLDLGDIIGINGTTFITQKGEKSVAANSVKLLSKCLHPLPEKWHGLADDEQKLRQRYLDLLTNEETSERFKIRHKIISNIRRYLEDNDFIEVETPVLQNQASGALATPFKTHHKALDIPLYLRIAPETYLKRLIVGGYERIFEIGKVFRNEGVDNSHLQEFTMLEFYAAYWNYKKGIEFVENLFQNIFEKLKMNLKTQYLNKQINWQFPWKHITYRDLVKQYTKLDLQELLSDEKKFIEAAKKFIDINEYKSLASMIDGLYKKYCRPNLIDPCIVTHQPSILGPLARVNDNDELWSDRFQIVVCGQEIVNAYSELVDPKKQREMFELQQNLINNGDEEAMVMEEDFLLAMEYAMPPMVGVGIGIDRIVALLTNCESLRNVVFFPNLR